MKWIKMLVLFGLSPFSFLLGKMNESVLPELFGDSKDHLVYFHSHNASPKELAEAAAGRLIFEIDLAWAHSSFHPLIEKEAPYIGHPEEFYTEMGRSFPEKNVSLIEFQEFLRTNPSIKVLIDVKDATTFTYLEKFIKKIGVERCIVHAFIKNWTVVPPGRSLEPHWYREDIDLFALDQILAPLGVPLIANCRGFSDQNIEENGVILKMVEDARMCKSVVCLGLYYPGAPLPDAAFLQSINDAGYYAWVNGNVNQFQEKIGSIKYIAMSDDSEKCSSL